MDKDHIIIAFGRFQPPTAGHHEMAQEVRRLADQHSADHAIFTFQTQGDVKNPLPPDVKEKHMRAVLGTNNVVQHEDIKTPGDVFQLLHNQGYKKITLVAGGGRAEEYDARFRPYFGKKTTSKKTERVLDLTGIHPDNYTVHKIERDADSDEGGTEIQSHMIDPKTNKMRLPFVSGSRMRAAANDSIHAFMSMLPSHVNMDQAKQLQKDLRAYTKRSIPKKKLKEDVSVQTRIKLSRAARRTAARRKITRRMREKRRKTAPQIKKRAVGLVRKALRQRVFKGNWKDLSLSSRANIDRQINRHSKLINSMVRKIMPKVIKGETERLKNVNRKNMEESMNPVLNNFFSNFITEAKTPKRAPKTGEEKLKRKAQNRNNQRTHRGRESNSIKSGDVRNKIMVVKNKKTKRIEIISKDSFNASMHEVKVEAKNATVSNVQRYLDDKAFANTDTSISLFGMVKKGAGGSKRAKKEKSEEPKEKKTKEKTSKSKTESVEPVQQMIAATKKASKSDTFPTSHNATDMESGIVYAMNSMLGLSPEQMVEKGLIDKKDLDAAMQNPNQSFLPSCQRAAQQILKQYGKVYVKHTGRLKKETKLTQEAKDNGVVDTTPKSDLILVDEKGNFVAGLSQKIGESQLSSGGPSETVTNLKWAMAQVGDKLLPSTKKQIEQFIKFFEDELSGNPRTKTGAVSLYQKGGPREGEDKEVARREKLHNKATEMLNSILNGDKKLAAAFVYALMSGESKFEKGSAAIATHIFSANRDGTNSKLTPITMDYCEKILDKVKFQMKFKSSAVETTDVKKMWNEFKQRKAKLGQKVSLEEDFRPYSFRSVIRSYLTENFLSGNSLIRLLIEKSDKIENMIEEPKTPEEAVEYLKDAFDYIGDDAFKLVQFFEDTIDFDITQPVLNWGDYANQPSTITNKIYINGKEFNIPVEEPYNYEDNGSMTSPLSEERNYRKEYDNYHSKPEQRKNRSKRVLARRLMMKLGRVKKGDGKDVDHKDGNPQNNGESNLRVRSKSENRADN